jgi:hypothetical protein
MPSSRIRRILRVVAETIGNSSIRVAVVTKDTRIGDFFSCLNMRHDVCAFGCICDQTAMEEELSRKLGFPITRLTRVYAASRKLKKRTLRNKGIGLQSK